MNGYVKMKRLRRVKITKIISAVTALSMTVTGLAVAASADSASPDFISNLLGDLTQYGIVANEMTNISNSDFESNFAVKNVNLGSHFHMENFTANKHRTVSMQITCEGKIEPGETKDYYFGVYCNGNLIDISYSGATVEAPSPIKIEFTEPGTKNYTFTIPSQYRYNDIIIHRLEPVFDENQTFEEFVIADGGTVLIPQTNFESECIISDSLTTGGETFGSNKVIKVGTEIFNHIDVNEFSGEVFYTMPKMKWDKEDDDDYWKVIPEYDNEGNPIYDEGIKIANGSVIFKEKTDAANEIDMMLEQMKSASDQLASVQYNSDNVTVYTVNGSIYCGSKENTDIWNEYARVKNNPNAYLLVNVKLEKGENSYVFNSGSIGAWDADESSRIIFNFIGGDVSNTHISLGDGFRGTVLAPNARVTVKSVLCGAIYAPQVTIESEVHMAPYRTLSHVYQAFFYEEEEITTTSEEETTPPSEETTTPPVEETTVPSETTSDTTVPESTPETSEPETTPETSEPETTPETTVPETTPDTTVPETTPDTTIPETTPDTTVPETTPDTTVPETTLDTTIPETTPDTTVPETTPGTTVPETTPDTTVPESTPDTTVPETTPDTTVPETTPDTTVPETTPNTTLPETTPDTTVPETTPNTTETVTTSETTIPETTPITTVPETTPETTSPVTTPDTTVPETTPNTTVSDSTPNTTTPNTPPNGDFILPTTTTTAVPETTPETTSDTTELPPPPETTTTVGGFGEENTPPETASDSTAPLFEVPETTTDIGIFSEENTPPVTTTVLTTTTTVPITFAIEEEVPRGVVPPNVPLIQIDEEVPLSDRPMNTGVESKVGLFAIIGGAALVIGIGAQAYSVFLKKKD